ncbi:unnamed protein product [Adineta steineri]|uniref:Uncharacterized protein n=2 Tax=Adineta steineri TaxID=433720 RepID=A0A814A1H9_9BILA|nr:unnamed protein product [Adineta steineri]
MANIGSITTTAGGSLPVVTQLWVYKLRGTVNILTLGNPLQAVPFNGTGGCKSQSIVPNVYDGSIDEFGVYSRELSSYDICALANP